MKIYIGLGSNVGDRAGYLRDAAHRIADHVSIIRTSRVFESTPVGVSNQPLFLNAVMEAETDIEPRRLLKILKNIEVDLGRIDRGRWQMREIDLDLIFADDLIINDQDLRLPHPEAHHRNFVACPLAELNPEFVHPITKQTIGKISENLEKDFLRPVVIDWEAPSATEVLCSNDSLINHGAMILRHVVDPQEIQGWYAAAKDLFSIDSAELRRYPRKFPSRSGYTPPGIEGVRYDGPSNLRHFFDFKPEVITPSAIFNSEMTKAWQKLHAIAMTILAKLSGNGETKLDQIIQNGEHHLRVAQYLNDQTATFSVLFPPHLDWSLITVFAGGVNSGLAIRIGQRWHRVEIPEDAVLIGAGTMLRLYKPEVPSMRHRVMADSLERISLFLFTEPRHDEILPNGETVGHMIARLEKETRKED